MLNDLDTSKTYVIFDLDGVLADSSARARRVFENGPDPDWKAYNEGVEDDLPMDYGIGEFHRWRNQGAHVIVLTARCASTRNETERWLRRALNRRRVHSLVMRPVGNMQSSTDWKQGVLRSILEQGCEVANAYEDCIDAVRMFEAHGVYTHYVYTLPAIAEAQRKILEYYGGKHGND